ncbi:hypothetical protein [Aurantiacibacter sp. MUD61]|uniref:hypothetical protein n=1 Tax=Aurantiacibacter sp. MUD61 TaxID=3009083 RepID=UPI0022F0EDB8|nr:hypothetical protein [Aurantiacibacter sp. MUD61]
MDEPTVSEKYIALAKECERQARECEQAANSPILSSEERIDKIERAKALWQLSRDHVETGMRLDAQRGKKIADAAKEAALLTNATHEPLRERRFARLKELRPKLGLQGAAAQCEREGMGKADAIVRQWNRHRRKSPDT